MRKTQFPFSDKKVLLYNLDVILAVGYRVNSKRGTVFRRWANQILKQYLINGFVINKDRVMTYDFNILKLEAEVHSIDMRLKDLEETVYSNNSQIIFEGEILEPYSFIMKLFYLAKRQLIIIDNYADDFLLKMLDNISLPITIYTTKESYLNKTKSISDNIKIINTDVFHDRYIIIDDSIYLIGTSINSIGKKRFTISKLKDISVEKLLMNIND